MCSAPVSYDVRNGLKADVPGKECDGHKVKRYTIERPVRCTCHRDQLSGLPLLVVIILIHSASIRGWLNWPTILVHTDPGPENVRANIR